MFDDTGKYRPTWSSEQMGMDLWRGQPDNLVPLCRFQVIFKLLQSSICLKIACLRNKHMKIFLYFLYFILFLNMQLLRWNSRRSYLEFRVI